MDLEKLPENQQRYLVDYVKNNFYPIKGINRKHSAYGLKQSFTSSHFYVTQEQFAEAMQLAGFQVSPLKNGNALFNISERSPHLHQDSE